jgi:hypothetical protein
MITGFVDRNSPPHTCMNPSILSKTGNLNSTDYILIEVEIG